MARRLVYLAALMLLVSSTGQAQIPLIHNPMPRPPGEPEFRVKNVEVHAEVRDQVATVQMAQTFQNVSQRVLETQFLFPLPPDAAINGLTLIVDGKELKGELKTKEEARRAYEEIVRQRKDPALLEFMDRGLFRTSVFPIPPGETRRVEIQYVQLLNSVNGLVDLTLPAGPASTHNVKVDELKIDVRIESTIALGNVYSATHDLAFTRNDEKTARGHLELKDVTKAQDVRILFGTKEQDVGISVVSFKPEDEEQGYFLLLASPGSNNNQKPIIGRTLLFVVDRSGSMAGEKMDQTKSALKYMLNSIGEQDTFNIVAFGSEVKTFRPELEAGTADAKKAALDYVADMFPGGGTNINGALTEALAQLKDESRPTYVLFMTDGLPTVGEVSEPAITKNAEKAARRNVRMFNFGVGHDVNSRLLDRLAKNHRGRTTYVKPNENIEQPVTTMFQQISMPAMTDIRMTFESNGKASGSLVNRQIPETLSDLFFGEQLIITGRYRDAGDVRVTLEGTVNDQARRLIQEAKFGNAEETRRNAFVAQLWATRRIGQIIDELDLNGQNKELVDELVALSLKYGIMTPYTSFLADETRSLQDGRLTMDEATNRLSSGLEMASGAGGFAQREFKQTLKNAERASSTPQRASDELSNLLGSSSGGRSDGSVPTAGLVPAPGGPAMGGRGPGMGMGGQGMAGMGLGEEPRSTVRKIGDRTFYWKNDEWQDAALLQDGKLKELEITAIEQFSAEYFELAKKDNGKWSVFLSIEEPILVLIGEKAVRIVPAKVE